MICSGFEEPEAGRCEADGRITREGLRDGSELAVARARALPHVPIRSDEEIAASLQATLAERGEKSDVWVFGYGSLIWNPTIEYAETRPALLPGWHRRFCLSSNGRGSPERPGVMLALDSGGNCWGAAFRLEEHQVEEELFILWRREMLSGSYHARWLTAEIEGASVPVLAFVANRNHPSFTDELDEEEIAERIAFARGPLGSCLEYLRNTMAGLDALGLQDDGLERVRLKVEAKLNAGSPAEMTYSSG